MVEIIIVPDEKTRAKKVSELVEAVKEGKKISKKIVIFTPEIFSQIFSTERIRLLLEIKTGKSVSITQLAGKVGRKFEAVHRDLKLFENYGLIKLTKKNKNVIPSMAEQISIPVIA